MIITIPCRVSVINTICSIKLRKDPNCILCCSCLFVLVLSALFWVKSTWNKICTPNGTKTKTPKGHPNAKVAKMAHTQNWSLYMCFVVLPWDEAFKNAVAACNHKHNTSEDGRNAPAAWDIPAEVIKRIPVTQAMIWFFLEYVVLLLRWFEIARQKNNSATAIDPAKVDRRIQNNNNRSFKFKTELVSMLSLLSLVSLISSISSLLCMEIILGTNKRPSSGNDKGKRSETYKADCAISFHGKSKNA